MSSFATPLHHDGRSDIGRHESRKNLTHNLETRQSLVIGLELCNLCPGSAHPVSELTAEFWLRELGVSLEHTPAHLRVNAVRPYEQIHDRTGSVFKVQNQVSLALLLPSYNLFIRLDVTVGTLEVFVKDVQERCAGEHSWPKWHTGEVTVRNVVSFS